MCRRVQCEVCQKPSYSGCGRHVEQVLGAVAEADRCQCRAARANMQTRARPSALGVVEALLSQPAA